MFWNRNTKFHQIILIGIFSILVGSSEQFKIIKLERNFYATATVISPHHVLTSSYVVLDEQKNWRYIQQPAQCSRGLVDLDVPPKVLKEISALHMNQAETFNVCNVTDNQLVNYGVFRKLMLAETSEIFENYFCLANDYTNIDGTELLDSYGRAWNNSTCELFHRKLIFLDYGNSLIHTEGYKAKDEFANIVVKEKDEKSMLLGIGLGAEGETSGEGEAAFYSIANIQNRICSLTGICEAPKTTFTTTTTTTTPTPTTPTSTNQVITTPMNHPPTTTTSQPPSTPSTSSENRNITISAIPHLKTPQTNIPPKTPEGSEPQEKFRIED
ncbi:Protein CBG25401 [Caenorhabditis briggsae]|uniref:Protein CBG25401 n=1 Tax=Caenorhabditis briggsae TaxID=6238 RepID=B6IH53_CAEBR|nr:Protein CBG25401 [Caenorhabditis briggsae]CAR99233.1 Protein CBG25401 [Caenorhabditis briggsae]